MQIHFFELTDSTNIRAKEFAENGAEHGTVVWALSQTAGRGRLGKQWSSPPGKGLYASFVLRPDIAIEQFSKLTLVAGVAVADFLKAELLVAQKKDWPIALKWPNDVYIDGKKIVGILAEASPLGNNGKGNSPYVVVGIGVNVGHTLEDFPDDIRVKGTSLHLETGFPAGSFQFEELLEKLHKSLLLKVERFENGEFPDILDEWRTLDYLKGKEMECVNIKGEIVRGRALGPDNEGVLHLEDKFGKYHEVLSGDVRLAGIQISR